MERNMLRKEKIRARDSLSAAEREALSERISRRILDSEEYRQAETLLIYKGRAGRGQAGRAGKGPRPRRESGWLIRCA